MTITTHKQLIRAMYDATRDVTPDELHEAVRTSGSRPNLISRALRRYWDAHIASAKFGLIGVGSISFAEARLAKFCRKVGLTVEG